MSYVVNPTGLTASVFGAAAAPVVWTNLNLGAVVGAQVVLAVLKIEVTGGINPRLAVRQDGEVDEFFAADGGPHGASRAFPTNANESVMLLAKTSAAGAIEWRASAASICEVFVLGHVVVSDVSTSVFADATLPTSYTDIDMGAVVGYRRVLAALKWHRTGGSAETFALRPNDDTEEYLVTLPEVAGSNQDGSAGINIYSLVMTTTDASGVCEVKADTGPPDGVLNMNCYAPLTEPTGTAEVFPAGAPPVGWAQLNLTSAGVPAANCLVALRVHHAVGAGLRVVAFRDSADGGDYLQTNVQQMKGCACAELESDQTTVIIVQCGPTGFVDWTVDAGGINFDVTVLGWVAPPSSPTATNYRPEDETFVSTGPIGATIRGDDAMDTATIGLTATDARGRVTAIVTAGVVQSPFTGTIVSTAPGDREVEVNCYDPTESIASGERHTFTLTATDVAGSSL